MKFARFFIDRPIFAAVLSIVIFLVGAIAVWRLPISQYPEVVPPSVTVRAQYPGANPKVIAETVAAPLEQEINGVEDMLYMSSQATSDGTMLLTITFRLGTDIDNAQVQVQNRVAQALPRLPEDVRRVGVTTRKASPDLLMVVHLTSPEGRYDTVYLRNYATLQVRDVLARLPGMGEVRLFGAGDYSMRVWLDPQRIASRGLTAGDVVRAIREQNVQVAAGVIGADPAPVGTEYQLNVTASGRLITEEEFGDIILKTAPDGGVTTLKDVARVELGAGQYSLRSLLNNESAVAIPIAQAPGANALELSDAVRSTMKELSKNFPQGIQYEIVYDPTVFVRDSIKAVIETLLEALALVVIVVIVFLQTWRASIIPLIAVPVSIVGTFALMLAFGFSINALSLFGLVLAIGIVVDDAIVVVENVERNIGNGLSPREATYKAMEEVSGPIIAIALVLVAVFVPIAFISGLTGEFYKQFALTIAISTVISAINSLTLSPALSALLLKPHGARPDALTRGMDRVFGGSSARFNSVFTRSSDGYVRGVRGVLAHKSIVMGVFIGLLGADVGPVPARAEGLHSDAGQAVSGRPRAAAERRVAESHRRGHATCRRHRAERSRRARDGAIPRPVDRRFHQQPELGDRVLRPRRVRRPRVLGALRPEHREAAQHEAERGPGRADRGVPAAGGAGPRHDRRLQAAARRPRRSRLRRALQGDAGRAHQSAPGSRAHGRVLELRSQRAADQRGRESRQGKGARHRAHRRVRSAAGLSRLDLHQRLQPFRPHVPGDRAGGLSVPREAGGHPAPADAQRSRRDGAARLGRAGLAELRPGSRVPLQRLPDRGRERRARTRLLDRPGAGGDGTHPRARRCRTA